jgi:hypothetical protein
MIVSPAQMHHYLEGADFPMSKAHIVRIAEMNGAPEHVRSLLEEVQDMEYENLFELMEEINIVEPHIVI